MRINISVIPRSSKNKVSYVESQGILKVWTTSPPVDGKANEAVVSLLAEYFKVPKDNISVRTGLSSKKKIVEIAADIDEYDITKKPRLDI